MSNSKFSYLIATIDYEISNYYVNGELTCSVKESHNKNGHLSISETNNSQ